MNEIACRPAPSGLWDLIARQARERGDSAYLEDARSDRTVTYLELHQRVQAWSRWLDRHGAASGCAIVVNVDDPLEFAVVHLAVVASGRCSVPVDPGAPRDDLRRTIAATRPVLMITDAADGQESDALGLLTVGLNREEDSGPVRVPMHGGAIRLNTSGSTGAPKTVELDEPRLLHVAASVAAHNRLTPADRGYNALPLFHVNAEVVGLLATLSAGATLVLDRRFHRTNFWALLAQRAITWVNAVPALLAIAATEPVPMPLSALRFIRSASAPLPVEIRQRIVELTGVAVIESYGMTEAASQITATPLDGSAPAGSAGIPVGVELEVRSDTGRPAGTGQIGRVWIRGAGVISGYLDGRGADRFDPAGWLATGDLGALDARGFLTLAGRADDVINRGGEMVYPREIEEVLLGDRRIREAIVVGRPDPVLGAVPVAYVLGPDELGGAELDALIAELERRCSSALSRFKRPAEIRLVSDLPRAATGKILRHQVRRELAARPLDGASA